MFFANDNRDSVREENPGITFGMHPRSSSTSCPLLIEASPVAGQVGKVLGEKWKALNPKQREPYEARAKADKERYESEKASYNNVSLVHTSTSPPFFPVGADVGSINQAAEEEEDEE